MLSGILNSIGFQVETKAIQQSTLTDCFYSLLCYYFGNFVIIAWYMPIQKEAWDSLHFGKYPPLNTKAVNYCCFQMVNDLPCDAILCSYVISKEYWGGSQVALQYLVFWSHQFFRDATYDSSSVEWWYPWSNDQGVLYARVRKASCWNRIRAASCSSLCSGLPWKFDLFLCQQSSCWTNEFRSVTMSEAYQSGPFFFHELNCSYDS